MTSLPAAPARTTLVEAPPRDDLSVVVRAPAGTDAAVQAGVGRSAMTQALPMQVPVVARPKANVAQIVVPAGAQIVRASAVARC
jgi:hypothetical protein